MADFNVEVQRPATRNDLAVLRLDGTLDAFSIPELEKTVQGLLQEKRVHLVINCEKLKFISSAGMGLFLGALGEVEKRGGSISFARVCQPEVHDAMSLLGFFEVFPLFDEEGQAIQRKT